MKLSIEEQEQKAINRGNNLKNQVCAFFKRTNEGSIKTRDRYEATGKRFCEFLGEYTYLQNFRNVEVRHVKAYVEYLQSLDRKPTYIITEVSGIKWIHKRMNPKRDLPKSNDCFELDKRKNYVYDMSMKDIEFKEGVKTAKALDRMDAVLEFYMGRYFGLRHEEFVTLRVYHIEHAIKYEQLHIKNTKGGRERDIPVDFDDKILVNKINGIICFVKDNPSFLMTKSQVKSYTPTREVILKEKQVKDMIFEPKPMFQPIKSLIYSSINDKYNAMDFDTSKQFTTALCEYISNYKMKTDILDLNFMKIAVSKIVIEADGKVKIKFVNGQEISERQVDDNE